MILNKTMTFTWDIDEVDTKVAKFSNVLSKFSCTWDMAIPTVTPIQVTVGEGEAMTTKVMVSIGYYWSYDYPMPQNFEEYFGYSDEKKEARKQYKKDMEASWGE